MKKFLVKATVVAALILPTASLARELGFDEFDCSESIMMKTSPLRCVNCGLQKYHDSKNIDSTVSEKWLALLSLRAMKTAPEYLKGNDKKQYIHKAVSESLQTYGYCSRYAEKGVSTKGGDDMTLNQKLWLKKFLNYDSKPSAEDWEQIALEMGFNGEFLWFWEKDSKANNAMTTFFERNALDNETKPDAIPAGRKATSIHAKRSNFASQLENEFGTEFDASGDRVAKNDKKSLIAKTGDDKGLRGCLREIYEKNKSRTLTKDKELYAVCNKIADACELPTIYKTPADVCWNGLALWPEKEIIAESKKAGVKYTPLDEKNDKSSKDPGQPPPPPPGGFNRSGNR